MPKNPKQDAPRLQELLAPKRRLTARERRAQRNEWEALTLLDRIRLHAPKYPKLGRIKKRLKDPHMLELGLYDSHFGKLCWHEETGEDYDLKIAQKRYIGAVEELLDKACRFEIEKIVFPVGQDFFNIDNKQNTTTAGTPQDCDGRYAQILAYGKEAVIESIGLCATIAPVEIIYCPGNHDELTSYHLCDYLSAWYRHSDRVKVDTSPKTRKYVAYGPVVIGFTHGNEEKHNDLVGIMLHEARELMATRRSMECHLGHFHRARATRFVNTDTHAGGVRVRVLPSLSGADFWHTRRGYVGSLQAAEAYLWNKRDGYAGHFSSNVKE